MRILDVCPIVDQLGCGFFEDNNCLWLFIKHGTLKNKTIRLKVIGMTVPLSYNLSYNLLHQTLLPCFLPHVCDLLKQAFVQSVSILLLFAKIGRIGRLIGNRPRTLERIPRKSAD